jgi:hypothetical protein
MPTQMAREFADALTQNLTAGSAQLRGSNGA